MNLKKSKAAAKAGKTKNPETQSTPTPTATATIGVGRQEFAVPAATVTIHPTNGGKPPVHVYEWFRYALVQLIKRSDEELDGFVDWLHEIYAPPRQWIMQLLDASDDEEKQEIRQFLIETFAAEEASAVTDV
jgi:hypothetical protein